MKITPGGVLLGVAALFFLVAGGLLYFVLNYRCCGVGFFESGANKFVFLAIPGIPFLLGVGALIVWKTITPAGPDRRRG